MQTVSALIPHREPFLFLSEITDANMEKIFGNHTFPDADSILKGSFSDFAFVPGMVIVESMAQCGGAGVKLLGVASGIFGLAAIENATFFKGVKFGEQIDYEIENIRLSDKLIKQAGKAYVNGQLVASASWMCIKING